MAKKALLTTDDGIYHKVKKGFLTDDNAVYRKVKKAFLTVGGVYRPCWSGGELVYWGTAEPLSVARSGFAATTVGNHALFGGGGIKVSPYYSASVDAYDEFLTRTAVTALSEVKSNLAATAVGRYALFGGGYSSDNSDGNYYCNTVDAYNESLTKITASPLMTYKTQLAATAVGRFALFGGGLGTSSTQMTAYDNTYLNRNSSASLSADRYDVAATTVGGYALFAGGRNSSGKSYNTVDAFDGSLTRISATALSVYRVGAKAITVGGHALIGGGNSATVDVYDESLTRTTAQDLSSSKEGLNATTVDGYALFGGGRYYSNSAYTHVLDEIIDAYDESLTKTTTTKLSVGRTGLAATTVGKYALFGGGGTITGENLLIVDAYTVV